MRPVMPPGHGVLLNAVDAAQKGFSEEVKNQLFVPGVFGFTPLSKRLYRAELYSRIQKADEPNNGYIEDEFNAQLLDIGDKLSSETMHVPVSIGGLALSGAELSTQGIKNVSLMLSGDGKDILKAEAVRAVNEAGLPQDTLNTEPSIVIVESADSSLIQFMLQKLAENIPVETDLVLGEYVQVPFLKRG